LNKTLAKSAAATTKKVPPQAVSAKHAAAPKAKAPAPAAPAKAAAKPKTAVSAAPKPVAAVVEAVVQPAPRPAKRASSRAQSIPTPVPAPITNRFTDRFAPARAPVKNHDDDVFKPAPKPDPKLVNAWKTKAARDLTEPELLAMPDSEYMNEKQREFFRLRLQAQKDDLLSNAGETTEHLREDTSIVPDPADRATIEEEHALELRTRDRERKLLKKIGQSIGRVEAGDYGFCDETGEPIGLARLLARPTATLSLEAQQRREMKQKMFGD